MSWRLNSCRMVAQWYNLLLETRETRVLTLPWASSGHVTTRSMSLPTLPNANLRYQGALDWRTLAWTKAGCSFLLLSAEFLSRCDGSSVVQSLSRDAGDPGSNPALGKQWSHDYPIDVPATPTLPYTGANGPKQDAASFFCLHSFD